ncbi:zinc-binding protein A33-like [Onychostoma macrolepis]|uniref:zinc-binding protein A33-like n=1 Tax=Onychostoma macrolepis TaxID=369639 RepID=UPI00272ABFE0|nr:zinc-binding protein A33-like [Onychostoma macrolepis]
MSSSSGLLAEELQCSVCLEVFTDPVSTPCGHNFCKSCLNQCWNNSQECKCPLCKETFSKRPDLKINTALRQVVQLFQEQFSLSKTDVLCDVCDDRKLKALKSCLVCQTSYCETHLEPHQRVLSFRKHKLTDPVKNIRDYICQKHERPLELFCRDDQTCVCVFCTDGDHKTHNTVPLEEESKEKKARLVKTQKDMQQMVQDRIRKIQDIRHSAKLRKKSTEREKAANVELFSDLIRSIERCQAELLEMMEEKQKAAEKQEEKLIHELEQEITELKMRSTEMDHLLHTEDHLQLLQIDPSLCSPPHTRNWPEISMNTDVSVETLRRALTRLQETLDQKLSQTVTARLVKTQKDMQQMVQDRIRKIQDIRHSAKLRKKSTEREKAANVELFSDLMRSIERCQAELLEMMEEKQKAAEKQEEKLIHELEQEITELKMRSTEMDHLLHTEDHLQLLQIDPSLCSPPHTRNWPEISMNTDVSVETLRRALTRLQETLDQKLSQTVLMRMQQYAVDVTLDPDTVHPNLILSNDGKQVRHGDIKQTLPNNPERFDHCTCVLGKDGFSSGRFYFEVQVNEKTKWNLGVARKSINRKGKVTVSPQDGFWVVGLWNENEYWTCTDFYVLLSLRVKPQKVGVFVDYEEGLVSFYDVESKSHIYSFTGQSFTEKLYPLFSPCRNEKGKNSAPLMISSFNSNE